MATKTVKVSDLSGEIIEDEGQAARLVVDQHPNYTEPITLDVRPQEVIGEFEDQESRFVVLTYYPPPQEASGPQHVVMPLEEFNSLATQGDMNDVLEQAHHTQQEEQTRPRGRGGSRATAGKQLRVNWASPERAGEEHPGRVSQAEKDYVRDHLDEVNARLRQKGMREIDPNDPKMAERYGLLPQPTVDAEAGGETTQRS